MPRHTHTFTFQPKVIYIFFRHTQSVHCCIVSFLISQQVRACRQDCSQDIAASLGRWAGMSPEKEEGQHNAMVLSFHPFSKNNRHCFSCALSS